MTAPPEPILDLLRGAGRHLWVGSYPAFEADGLVLFGCTNFRAAAGLHQQYDVVWCYEEPVTNLHLDAIPLALDELIRFVGAKGRVVVRYDLGQGVLAVKNFFGRRVGLTSRILHEEVRGDMITTVFEVEREHVERYRAGGWTFGLLTQGTRKANVVAFLKSVRDRDPANDHQIVICGPEDPDYAFAKPEYLSQTYHPERAEISRKKNDIARAATRPNLLLAHDRYKLEPDFFVGFDQYGYDFDFVAVTQRFEDGAEFPGYCHLTAREFRLTPPMMTTDLNTLPGVPFLNGGLFAVKTHLLRAVPLNDLSYWNQAEDVELSTTLLRHGVPPRLNPYSTATTFVGREHIKAFLPAHPEAAAPAAPPAPPSAEPAPPRPGLLARLRQAARGRKKPLLIGLVAALLLLQAVNLVAVVLLVLSRGAK